MANYYDWLKVAHIIAVISWLAAMFYMPRLFVYHTKAASGSEMDLTFQVMERKLLRLIMTPAMVAPYLFGLLSAYVYGFAALGTWFHIKMLAVLGLTLMHGLMAKWRKAFCLGQNKHSERFYRVINEVPVVLMITAVVMVVVKPFE